MNGESLKDVRVGCTLCLPPGRTLVSSRYVHDQWQDDEKFGPQKLDALFHKGVRVIAVITHETLVQNAPFIKFKVVKFALPPAFSHCHFRANQFELVK